MKTKVVLLAFLLCGCAGALGQTNSSSAGNPSASATPASPETAAVLAPSAQDEQILVVMYDQTTPLADVIQNLAGQINLPYQYAPSLMSDGKPGPLLLAPVGPTRFENVTARQALDRVLAAHNLTVTRDPATNAALILAKPAGAADPNAPVDLANQPTPQDGSEMEGVFEPGKEIPLLLAIQFLANRAKINIMIDPRVKAGVTLTNGVQVPGVATNTVSLSNFGGVSARQTLDAVLNNFGLALIVDQRTQFAQVALRDPLSREPLITQVIQLRYSNASNLVTLATTTLIDARSKITFDARTGQLITTTTQREYEALTNLVAQLDTPTKQVLIEAQLVETSKNPSTVKGIDWSGTLQGQNVSLGNGVTSGQTTTTLPGSTVTATTPNGRTITETTPSSASSVLNTTLGSGGLSLDTVRGLYPQTAFLNADGAHAVLSFFNSDSESEVVAKPQAVMLDNQKAELSVSRAYPIFTVSPGAANIPATATITYTNLGTFLRVTPKIAANERVFLNIEPEVSNIDSKDQQTINGQVNSANVYAIRRMQTQVIVPSGTTLVMGGLISDSTSKGYQKVPVLGDIPIIGLAFRHESKTRNKVNLLIFITPTIIHDEDFHPTTTDFLQNMPPGKLPVDESAWNSGKPYQWKKSKSDDP